MSAFEIKPLTPEEERDLRIDLGDRSEKSDHPRQRVPGIGLVDCQCDECREADDARDMLRVFATLDEVRRAGRRVAELQPAAHATTQEEADLWAAFYRAVGGDALDVVPARLDPDGTAKPRTRLVGHARRGDCIGPGSVVADAIEDTRTGKRTPLGRTA